MNNEELWHLYDGEFRRQVNWTRMQCEELPGIVRYISDDHHDGFIAWSNLTDETADRKIEEQIAYFSPMMDEFEWKWYSHDHPADLREQLLCHGFVCCASEALVVMDLEDAPAYIREADSRTVRKVTSPAEIDEIIAMENEIWHKDLSRLGEGMKSDLEHNPDLFSIFGVWQDGHVVSAAWQWYMPPTRWVSLFGGSTLEQYRRRGYYTALIAVRAREARERGYRFLNVDASPDSQTILEKQGFRLIGQSIEFDWIKPKE